MAHDSLACVAAGDFEDSPSKVAPPNLQRSAAPDRHCSPHSARLPASTPPFLSFRRPKVLRLHPGHSEIFLIFRAPVGLSTFLRSIRGLNGDSCRWEGNGAALFRL